MAFTIAHCFNYDVPDWYGLHTRFLSHVHCQRSLKGQKRIPELKRDSNNDETVNL